MDGAILLPAHVAEDRLRARDDRAAEVDQQNRNLLGILFTLLEEVGTEVGDRLEFIIPAHRVKADRPMPKGVIEYDFLGDGRMRVYWNRTG